MADLAFLACAMQEQQQVPKLDYLRVLCGSHTTNSKLAVQDTVGVEWCGTVQLKTTSNKT